MKKRLKYLLALLVLMLCFLILHIHEHEAYAASDYVWTNKDFHIVDSNGNHLGEGGNTELLTSTKDVFLSAERLEGVTNIEWSSSNPELVSVSPSLTNPYGAILTRNGPGYARITVSFDIGSAHFFLSMLVEVGVEIKDKGAPGEAVTPLTSFTTDEQRAVILNYCEDPNFDYDKKPNTAKVYLKYTQDQDNVKNEFLKWETSDESVVAVTDTGELIATGTGRAKIHITTKTVNANGKPMELFLDVLVNPLANINIYNNGKAEWVNNGVIEVGSSFSLPINSKRADHLRWVVKDSAGNVLEPDSVQFSYKVHKTNPTFEVINAKVGVYTVQAFIEGLTDENVNVDYLNFKVIVPFRSVGTIIMNVSDTYNLVENMNMAEPFISIESSSPNIVEVNRVTGVLKAKNTGTVTVKLGYEKYEDNKLIYTEETITVIVIDALALSLTDATIPVKGTVKLDATVTDPTAKLTWKSSNPAIATVEDGLVTGITPGEAVITVSTKIGGVYKEASCNVLVVAGITGIQIDPQQVNMNIGEFKTLQAVIAPSNINNADLKWVSSNEKIVQITETGKKYATIKAIASGHVVISAINKDNIVIGHCEVTVNQPVTGIELSEKNVTLSLSSGGFQLRVKIQPATATNQKVTFMSTNTSVVRVDSEGKVTLVGAGNASIIVTSESSPNVSAICNVTVTTPVTGISLDNTKISLIVGESYRLTYSVMPTTATNRKVIFTTSDPKVCTVTEAGIIRALGVGNATINVTTEDGKYTQSATVSVTQFATSIDLEDKELKMNIGETHTIKYKTTPANTNDVFTFETTNAKVATVSAAGKITAVNAGTAIIMIKTNRGLTAFCYVEVSQKATGIVLNCTEKTIVVKQSFNLKATVLPSGASNQKVTYSSRNEKIAKVSNKGKVTGVRGGTTIITVKSEDGEFVETCFVTVKELVTSVSIKSSHRIAKGKTYVLKPTIKTNTATKPKLVWTSSNTKVVKVSSTGKIKAVGYGRATIKVSATDGSGAYATCKVKVIQPVTSIELNHNIIKLMEGKSKYLKATIRPKNATYKNVTWSSSDETIAIVNNKGKVTALKDGTAIIYAQAGGGSKKKAKCVIHVSKKVPSSSITVADQSVVMVTGESKTIQAVMNPTNTTDGYRWSSDNTAVATVNKSTGRIVAKAIGTATITVMTDSGKTAKITVNVVGLSKSSLVLEQYSTHTLWVDGNKSNVTWDIENPNIATISNGKVTSRSIGSTRIIATVNGRRLYCKLKVTKIR